MKTALVVAFGIAIAGSLIASAAQARPITLREALKLGYEVKSTTFIPQEQIGRAMGDTTWKDDILLTLQRGSQLAFCHLLVTSTTNIDGTADGILCTYTLEEPIVDAPASSSEEPASSMEPASSVEPASSAMPASSSSAQ